MAYEQPIDLDALYRSLFGRTADADGLAHWQAQAPGIVQSEGINGLRQQMADAAAPNDIAQYQRTQTAGLAPSTDMDWTSYMASAGLQDRGINSMPGVYSDYGALAGAPADQNQAAMYHDKDSLKAIVDEFKALYGVGSVDGLGGLGGGNTSSGNSGGGLLPRRAVKS